MQLRPLLLATLLCAATAAQAADDYTAPGPYVGLGGTYAFRWLPGDFDRDLGLGNTVRSDNTGGLNVRGGYRFLSWLSAELEYEWLDGFEHNIRGGNGGFSQASHVITANGKAAYPGWGRFQPWLLVGIGLQVQEAERRRGLANGLDRTSVGFAARAGLGLDTHLTQQWVLHVGVEAVVNTTEIDNSIGGDLDQFFYVPLQVGLLYRF